MAEEKKSWEYTEVPKLPKELKRKLKKYVDSFSEPFVKAKIKGGYLTFEKHVSRYDDSPMFWNALHKISKKHGIPTYTIIFHNLSIRNQKMIGPLFE